MVLHEQANLAIATETLSMTAGLVTLPVYSWEHTVVVRPDHPLADLPSSAAKNLSLKQLAAYLPVPYDRAFSGRCTIGEMFAGQGRSPDIEPEAISAVVVKTDGRH